MSSGAMDGKKTGIERSSGNVFRDLGLPEADTHLLKAELVSRIEEIIRRRRLKQTEAAKLLGLSQPDVSRLLRGDFREYSMERLFRLLTALGRDVEIVIRRTSRKRVGRLSVAAFYDSESSRQTALAEEITREDRNVLGSLATEPG